MRLRWLVKARRAFLFTRSSVLAKCKKGSIKANGYHPQGRWHYPTCLQKDSYYIFNVNRHKWFKFFHNSCQFLLLFKHFAIALQAQHLWHFARFHLESDELLNFNFIYVVSGGRAGNASQFNWGALQSSAEFAGLLMQFSNLKAWRNL